MSLTSLSRFLDWSWISYDHFLKALLPRRCIGVGLQVVTHLWGGTLSKTMPYWTKFVSCRTHPRYDARCCAGARCTSHLRLSHVLSLVSLLLRNKEQQKTHKQVIEG